METEEFEKILCKYVAAHVCLLAEVTKRKRRLQTAGRMVGTAITGSHYPLLEWRRPLG